MLLDPKQDYHSIKTHKGMLSFLVFLISIVLCISIFHTFKLSPSNLFNNTKFWFFISNTLILIIAIDYGSFSSSKKNKQDLYEEFVRRTSQPISSTITPSFVSSHFSPKEDVQDVEEIKEVITSENAQLVPENKFGGKKCRRSKSERVKRVNSDESKNFITRSSSEKLNELARRGEEEEEENEFSNMSNEELNRRVEEFIQRFNRQIRLQRRQNFGIE